MRRMALAWPSLRAAAQAWEGGAGRTALAGGPQDHAPARQLFTSQWAQARARRTRTELAPLKTTVVTAEGEERPAIEPYTPPSLNVPALATILQRPALVVTRPIEWGTVLLGFEQANRYSIYDEQGVLVAHLLEEEGGIGRAVGRQLLRTRRPFTATVLNAEGEDAWAGGGGLGELCRQVHDGEWEFGRARKEGKGLLLPPGCDYSASPPSFILPHPQTHLVRHGGSFPDAEAVLLYQFVHVCGGRLWQHHRRGAAALAPLATKL